MNRRTRILVFVGVLLITLAATIPARMAFSIAGDRFEGGADDAAGTLWSGRFPGAHAAGIRLGDAQTAIDALPLLTGALDMGFATEGSATESLRGKVRAEGSRVDVTGLNGSIRTAALNRGLSIIDGGLAFVGGRCDAASGTVRADLSRPAIAAGPVSGTLSCVAGTLVVQPDGGGPALSLGDPPGPIPAPAAGQREAR